MDHTTRSDFWVRSCCLHMFTLLLNLTGVEHRLLQATIVVQSSSLLIPAIKHSCMHTWIRDTTAYIAYLMWLQMVRFWSREMFQSFRHYIGTLPKSILLTRTYKKETKFLTFAITQNLLFFSISTSNTQSLPPLLSLPFSVSCSLPSCALLFPDPLVSSPLLALHLQGN